MTFEHRTLSSWKEFRDLVEEPAYRDWAFRGQADASWQLLTSLSRHLMRRSINQQYWRQLEERSLRIFRRKAHHFLQHVPVQDDSFQWLSLMQHYGAPTRLLDLTWSPYVGAFFALESATVDAAVWALNPELIMGEARPPGGSPRFDPADLGPWVQGHYEEYFLPNTEAILVIGEPHEMAARLIAQSGTFAMPGLLDVPIETLASQRTNGAGVMKLTLTQGMRLETLRELYRANITRATLFPGLDGLARSLAFELEYHWAFDPRSPRS